MCSDFPREGPLARALLLLLVCGLVAVLWRLPVPALTGAHAPARESQPVLRVCADPNNLPFSNDRLEGFENEIARLLADTTGARLEYTWWAQRRGFIRNTLNANACDVVLGVPASLELALPTRPYYRSTYVFVTRRNSRLRIRSFDDPVLCRLSIGVHLIGDDFANAPPAHALAKRGIVGRVRGYMVYGDYSQPDPPARLIQAVSEKEVDVAIAWGPLAGFFAPRQREPLDLTPVSPQIDLPFLPFVFDVAMAVRRDDTGRRDALDRFIESHRIEIDRILARYGVPRVDAATEDAP
jgi:mxaJ protein